MRFVLWGMFLMASLTPARAQDKQATVEDPSWVKAVARKPLVYTVSGMDRVRVRRDVIYKRVGAQALKMDIYRPAESTAKLPAILFIHGGFLPPTLRTQPKDWQIFADYGRMAAASGFVGIAFNHRLYENWMSVENSTSDLGDAIAYVRENADSLGVDSDRIVLWAFSGGGPLLSLAIRDPQPSIRCMVSYYALLDLMESEKESRGTLSEPSLLEHSPLHQLEASTKSIAPLFIARMGKDHPNISASVDHFISAAFNRGVTLTVSNDPEGHHGFDVEDDTDASRAVIRETMQFVKVHTATR